MDISAIHMTLNEAATRSPVQYKKGKLPAIAALRHVSMSLLACRSAKTQASSKTIKESFRSSERADSTKKQI